MSKISGIERVRVLERLPVFSGQPAFKFFHIFRRRQAFRTDTAFKQSVAHGLVIGDMFPGNRPFSGELILSSVEDSDFGGKVFGLEDDGGSEIGQGSAVRNFPVRLHRLGSFPE